MSDFEYNRMLHRIIDQIFEAWDGTWIELAYASDCSINTVYNLGNYTTVFPRLKTVIKLAKAVKVKIVIDFKTKKIKIAA